MSQSTKPFHSLPVRVYYQDTDAGGVVYHPIYLNYAERGRTEMMRSLGIPPAQILAQNHVSFAVRKCILDYFLPARLDDALEVYTYLGHMGAATLELDQEIRRTDDVLVRLNVTLVAINRAGGAVRIPGSARDRLKSYMNDEHGKIKKGG